MLKSWIDESYRAQAPKKLVAMLAKAPVAAAAPPVTKKKASTKRATVSGTPPASPRPVGPKRDAVPPKRR